MNSHNDIIKLDNWKKRIEENKQKVEYYYNNHLLDHLYRAPIFVFTPAKVGGSSIRESIMEHYNNRVPTTFDYVPMLHDLVQGFNRNLLNTNFYKDAVFSCTVEEIKKTIQSRKEKIKIITLFRDPIARNISIIFEAMLTLWIDTDEPYKNFSHWNDLLNYWLEDKIKPESMIDWFDDQLNLVFNINILEHTFDAKAGYTIIENDWVECLILRTDKIDLNHQVIKDFCNVPELNLKRYNTAKEKWYNYLYQSFIQNYKPAISTVQMLYNNPVTEWFFTHEEIHHLKNKWIKKEG